MLSPEDNALLTQTGPGTLMGDLLRRYWTPALLSAELADPDGVPVRVRLLGEDLVAFRATDGSVGLVGNHCPHRGASLYFGRNEENGLRCVYHGWKFDVSGACIDMPNEPPESNFKEKVRQTAYPCVDQGGVIWAYLGPADKQPALPALEWTLVPPSHRYLSKRIQECNWAQAVEGGIDSSHVSFLHRDESRRTAAGGQESAAFKYMTGDGSPVFELAPTDFGLLIGARRNAEADSYYWRITPWLFPWYTMIPGYGDRSIGGHAWVPMDDEHCWVFNMNWHPARSLTEKELEGMRSGGHIHVPLIPGTFTPLRNKANDYLLDRDLQRRGVLYTGILGTSEQDAAVQESMGAIYDRSQEHLGASDAAIIQVRRRWLQAARDLARGLDPPALDPDAFRVRSASLLLPRDVISWPEAAKEALTARAGTFTSAVA